jgi:UDP-N-acetylmuramyl tripeptide synthase
MATNPQISYAAANAEANALAPLMNSGKLRIYSGTIPTRTDDVIGAAVLLAELTMNATAFGASANGVITANAITGANAGNTGTASFYRIWDSAGTTAYIQGTVGTATSDMIVGSVAFSAGAAVTCTALTHTVVRGA